MMFQNTIFRNPIFSPEKHLLFSTNIGIDTSARAGFERFPDGNTVSPYAVDAMSWAVATSLINGSDGKLLPQAGATRAQVATILMRFFQGNALN